MDKIKITLPEIISGLRGVDYNKYDFIIGIGRGGIIPASIISYISMKDLLIIWISLRNEENKEMYDTPKLVIIPDILPKNKNILLVDDVSRTGKTLDFARKLLKGNAIETLVINGKADYSIFNYKKCIEWPWN